MPENPDIELINQILHRQTQFEKQREMYEDIWDEVSYFGCSRRPDFKGLEREGKKYSAKIYDGTPTSALNLYVDGIQGYHISRALEWFSYRIGGYRNRGLNENREIRNWLQDVKESVYWELNESNFYDAIREFLLDGASIGNANLFIDEIVDKNEITFLVHHPRQIWFAENKLGEPDVVHRKFELTVKQAVEEFGKDKVSQKIQEAYDRNAMDEKYEFLRAIYPIDDLVVTKYDKKSKSLKKFKNYISYYIEKDQKILLRRKGLVVLNPIIWRLKKYSGEVYGRGLLGDAISEVKRLNSASKTMMQIAQTSAEPPMNVPFEMKGEEDTSPGGKNYYRDASRMLVPVQTGHNYPVTEDYITRLQEAIERHFQVEFFLMLARQEGTMTATEIIEKQGEKVALMSSQLSQLSQHLNKIHNRILNLMYMQGKLPPVPGVLLGNTGGNFVLDIDYVGPLAEAQKRLFKARGIRHSLEVAAPYIQMFPGFVDSLNDVALAQEFYISHGMPAKVMREPEEIAAIRQQREQMVQQQVQAEIADTESKAVQKLGKEVEQDSVIDKAMGTT